MTMWLITSDTSHQPRYDGFHRPVNGAPSPIADQFAARKRAQRKATAAQMPKSGAVFPNRAGLSPGQTAIGTKGKISRGDAEITEGS